MTLIFGSLFSGIGGFDLGFERAGMVCKWQVEADVKAKDVLNKHWPEVKKYDDVRNVGRTDLEPVDVICGGFPCQDVSIAGRREGLNGKRSGLWFEFARIIDELEPRWVVIENVPGLLSSAKGRDFATILRWLVERGYCVAWRVLDAQYFGVAQRRRRVFVVASFGNGGAAEILFESEGMRWNPPPRQKAGQGYSEVAGTIAASGAGLDRPSGNGNELDFCVPVSETLDLKSCGANRGGQANVTEFITAFGGNNSSASGIDISTTSNAHGGAGRMDFESETFVVGAGVRRLTPTECARLQGFPDDWNDWQTDSARYKQYGNAVCVNVAEWIGMRLTRPTETDRSFAQAKMPGLADADERTN